MWPQTLLSNNSPPIIFLQVKQKNREKALALNRHGNGATLSSSSPLLIYRLFCTPKTHKFDPFFQIFQYEKSKARELHSRSRWAWPEHGTINKMGNGNICGLLQIAKKSVEFHVIQGSCCKMHCQISINVSIGFSVGIVSFLWRVWITIRSWSLVSDTALMLNLTIWEIWYKVSGLKVLS